MLGCIRSIRTDEGGALLSAPFADVSLGKDLVSEVLSADLMDVMGDDVDTCVWSEDGGATFQGGINLFADHWITFELLDFLFSDRPEAGEPLRSDRKAELRARAFYLRRVAEELDAAANQPALAYEGPTADRWAAQGKEILRERQPRIRIKQSVVVLHGGEELIADALNVSLSGILMLLPKQPSVGSSVTIHHRNLCIEGRVVWSSGGATGVEFLRSFSPEDLLTFQEPK